MFSEGHGELRSVPCSYDQINLASEKEHLVLMTPYSAICIRDGHSISNSKCLFKHKDIFANAENKVKCVMSLYWGVGKIQFSERRNNIQR